MLRGGSIFTLSRRVKLRRLLEAVLVGGCWLGVPPSPYVLLKFFETGELGPDPGFGAGAGCVCGFAWLGSRRVVFCQAGWC
jgi:hypothetical protein